MSKFFYALLLTAAFALAVPAQTRRGATTTTRPKTTTTNGAAAARPHSVHAGYSAGVPACAWRPTGRAVPGTRAHLTGLHSGQREPNT